MMLVDSDILIAHLRGIEVARDWLVSARRAGPLSISVVTVTELVGGMRSPERRAVWRLLDSMTVKPINELVARRAGDFMHEHRRSNSGIGLADYLIAATAEINGLDLATLNIRHFPMFDGLEAPFALPAAPQ
ncbi:type II toxin-antitoxin system VapC family toxin [Mycolicibacterium phocaicum]|uniref:Ribonuclease VapC n=1 Tax=Mycolicibacterium phocaicum TaxID=319706 RepID=A0A7I7ZJD6_9MYCO|nr:type II toxin-antitoxin system VapC family toxin [Mycolicibacterium phocaicum]TLH69431.1 VapC toxin family PIN domain ribonuclease [Mycolicibacterium phocaicum]BBZ54305.1 ribonuclease VapC [Mycolicibacterium phocaicum]